MRYAAYLMLTVLAFVDTGPHEAAIPYFAIVRDVRIAQADRQNFFTIDTALWNHSRPDLGDIRLYDGNSPVQYFMAEQSAGVSSEEAEAKIVNLGSVAGHTEFDLDANGIAEYNRIRLHLDAKDFVVTASVAGGSELGQTSTDLPPVTFYDFSSEQLGSNFTLKVPPSSFRYLHIKLSHGVRPQQVKGATISNLREWQASWTNAGQCSSPRQQPRVTVFTCAVPSNVPLNRIQFQIDPGQVNFHRSVSVEDAKTNMQLASGNLSRVRMNRGGTLVTAEELSINTVAGSGHLTVTVQNGDNPLLAILAVQPLALERRVYFDAPGKSLLRLYYGDEKLPAPVYDYARFFRKDAAAAEATLGAEAVNAAYTGRSDERPWSERHKGILWAAMLLAVVALGVLAILGLGSPAPQ
ncbi:MAG TPA: DUF3999 family protein [Candidatus Eremiobacteraceae bacterium]|nr:DUF3999 family protein [Candidatus Eremiobacteraceae bacterium]